MEIQVSPEVESRLEELAAASGRPPGELVEDAMASYLDELAEVRHILSSRYDEAMSGAVALIDGEAFFASLLDRETLLVEQRNTR
jgi:predicted transcriptional regulator